MKLGLKNMRTLLFAAAVGAAAIGTAAPASALDPAQSVFARKTMMWSIGAHMRGIVAGIKGKDGKTVAAAANAIAAMSAAMLPLFVKGTEQGGAHKTRAKADIWAKWDDFKAANEKLQAEAKKLAEVAGTNDPKAMLAQFKRMGAMGCGGCHRPFRGPK